jgi:flagellar basal body-associated protein FliL
MKSVFGFTVKMTLVSLGLVFFASTVHANEDAAFAEGINYLPIKPALVVNYGGPGKVKYIKAEISMRVEDAKAAEEVTHHMPLVRDTLIMLLSSMTDEQVSSGEGKELMRQQALAKVNAALEAILHPVIPEKKSAKDDHGKKSKDAKGKDAKSKDSKSKDKSKDKSKEPEKPEVLVSDLLFDNLVVQK